MTTEQKQSEGIHTTEWVSPVNPLSHYEINVVGVIDDSQGDYE
jgi:hypothetical protein